MGRDEDWKCKQKGWNSGTMLMHIGFRDLLFSIPGAYYSEVWFMALDKLTLLSWLICLPNGFIQFRLTVGLN